MGLAKGAILCSSLGAVFSLLWLLSLHGGPRRGYASSPTPFSPSDLPVLGCLVVHAPEIEAGYCEAHKRPVFTGNVCDKSADV